MEVAPLAIAEVLLVQPEVFGDARGQLLETFQAERYGAFGVPGPGERFVQDTLSRSARGVLRGLHLQHPGAQGKLVHVVEGAVYDVAVDARVGSPTFGRWVGQVLDGRDHHQLWIPPGFAHGLLALTEVAVFAYKCTAPYAPEAQLAVRYDDPDLAIPWPLAGVGPPTLSARDAAARSLATLAAEGRLPVYVPAS